MVVRESTRVIGIRLPKQMAVAFEKKAAGRNVCLKGLFQDRPELKREVWEFLNELYPQAMLGEGREQVIGAA